MSDFLYSSRPRAEGELRGLLERFLGSVSESTSERHGEWGSLAVALCAHDHEPLAADERGISVLLGWPVVHGAAGLAPAPVLDTPRREEVHRLLREAGAAAAAHALDGPFAAITIDVASRRATALTDRMGFIPLFTSSPAGDPDALLLGSHVDAVALAAGRERQIDPVSLADFVVHSSITYPATLYEGVEQFPPAAERSWRDGRWEGPASSYWLPLEQSPLRYLGHAARSLRRAFQSSVQYGCEGRDHVGLLLSGGEDSRSVLGAIPPGIRVDAFIFGDWENREYRIARRVAALYGADLHFGQREPDHYLDFASVAPMLGTQHRYTDVHGFGLHSRLGLARMPIVLGGYLSDSLLKANYAHAPKRRLVRRATPREGERAPPTIANAPGLREDLLREVELRRGAHLARLRELRPFSAAEWLVLWPFTMRATSANLHGNRRLFRGFEPFMSNGVLEIAAAVPQWWKRERLLFHRAMRPFLARSWNVPHGRSKYPFFGPVANVPLGIGVKWGRALRDRATGEAGRVQGPWPELSDLVRTPAMQMRRDSVSLEGSPVATIFEPGSSPARMLAGQRQWTPEQQLGFLQMVYLVQRVQG